MMTDKVATMGSVDEVLSLTENKVGKRKNKGIVITCTLSHAQLKLLYELRHAK